MRKGPGRLPGLRRGLTGKAMLLKMLRLEVLKIKLSLGNESKQKQEPKSTETSNFTQCELLN